MAKIISVDKDSIAYDVGIEPGDELLEVNGKKATDILMFMYQTADPEYEITVKKKDGTIECIDIINEYGEDLGVEFENPLLTKAKSCANKCVFCFIDQLPKGMRESLYFKDDDSRLSFLHGNYVTLTNISDRELDNLIEMRMSPINVSVQCTDPEIRKFMLGNKRAGKLLEQLKKLSDAEIEINCQVVLCKNINDGKILDKTIRDLEQFIPNVNSICIVPLGMTKFREGLYPMEAFSESDCKEIVRHIEDIQKEFERKYGTKIIYLADEFYIEGNVPFPDYEDYDEFPQLENGVGMAVLLEKEFNDELSKVKHIRPKKVSIATGKISEDLINKLVSKVDGIECNVFGIRNDFFGESITVSGLVTGGDIIKQLKGKSLGEYLLIPENMLRVSTDIFLDDYTVGDVERELNIKIKITNDGYDLVHYLTD